MATELEECSFKTLHPIRYNLIKDALKKNDLNRKTLIAKVKKSLSNKFKQAGIDGKITGREKRIFSIYQKMETKHRSFSDIYDVFAFRVLVDKAEDTYRALGIIHNMFTPITGKFKDYIAVPKTNGYQALHTVVMTFDGVPNVQVPNQLQRYSEREYSDRSIWAYSNIKVPWDKYGKCDACALTYKQATKLMQSKIGRAHV